MNIVSDFARFSVAEGGTHGGMESISTLKSDNQIDLEDSAALRLLHPCCPIRAMQRVFRSRLRRIADAPVAAEGT